MTLYLDDLVVATTDCPDKIPLGGKLDFTKSKLSDGSNLVTATGWTPNDTSVTGTLRSSQGSGNPMLLSDRIEAKARAGKTVRIRWTSELGPSKEFDAIITEWTPTIIDDNRIEYTLAWTREQQGGLITSVGVLDQQTRLVQHHKNLESLKSKATASTAAAIGTANSSAASIPPPARRRL